MLNKNNERELCYVVKVDAIEPIEGSDNCEAAVIGGWRVMVHKGEFEPNDPAIYFEIDSKVDASNPTFSFLAKKDYKIKTQKYTFGGKGNFISQGLLMSADDFGWEKVYDLIVTSKTNEEFVPLIGVKEPNGETHYINNESRFLTKQLKVTYAVAADNKRKAPTINRYERMIKAHPKLFKIKFFNWLVHTAFGREFFMLILGTPTVKRSLWPEWVRKTDEERIENLPHLLQDKREWIATEKIDGTSTTFTLKRNKKTHEDTFLVCSRNVVFDKPDKKCFYTTNVYVEMAEKYHIQAIMRILMDYYFPECDWITIQGETYGGEIQKRNYSTTEHNFMAFNFITSTAGRWNTIKMKELLEDRFHIPCVPILNEHFVLPDTIDELRTYVDMAGSAVDGELREGIVCRSLDGSQSFKCVSPTYLLKYHG